MKSPKFFTNFFKLVGSAPNYPSGSVDPIKEISKVQFHFHSLSPFLSNILTEIPRKKMEINHAMNMHQ